MKGEFVCLEVRLQVTKEEIALYIQMPQEWQLLQHNHFDDFPIMVINYLFWYIFSTGREGGWPHFALKKIPTPFVFLQPDSPLGDSLSDVMMMS